MAKHLSDTARTILAAAAARPNLHLLPVPSALKAPAVVVRKTIGALIQTGLAAEAPAGPGEPLWEHTEASNPVTLVATPAGLAAVRADASAETPEIARRSSDPEGHAETSADVGHGGGKAKRGRNTSRPAHSGARGATSAASGGSGPRSKQEICLALLRRANGASIAELMQATSWRAHSVRGFLSGALKKRLGIDLVSEKDVAGERRYHLAALRSGQVGH